MIMMYVILGFMAGIFTKMAWDIVDENGGKDEE